MRIIEYGKKYRKDMHVSTMAEWEPIKLSMKMRDVIVSKIKRNTIFCSPNFLNSSSVQHQQGWAGTDIMQA